MKQNRNKLKVKNVLGLLFALLICANSYSQNADSSVVVKDSSQYDRNFIKYWGHLRNHGVVISNDSIVVAGDKKDAIIIPTDLPLKQDVQFVAAKGDTMYVLTVNRQNYTNIHFSIVGSKDNLVVFERNDTAILESSFYLGCEGVYEKSEKEIFGMNDYNITNHGKHKLLIPVGTDEVIDYYEPAEPREIVLQFKKTEEVSPFNSEMIESFNSFKTAVIDGDCSKLISICNFPIYGMAGLARLSQVPINLLAPEIKDSGIITETMLQNNCLLLNEIEISLLKKIDGVTDFAIDSISHRRIHSSSLEINTVNGNMEWIVSDSTVEDDSEGTATVFSFRFINGEYKRISIHERG